MTTTITNFVNNIDVTYPIPGVDNDTQGFRDNFANIKNALKSAASEITGLLLNSVRTDEPNDFNGNEISNARLKHNRYSTYTLEDNSGEITIDFDNGYYQTIEIDESATVSFTGWPGVGYGAVKLEITSIGGTTATVTFSGIDRTDLEDLTDTVNATSTNTSEIVFYEAWSADAGDTVFLRKVGGTFV